MQRAKLHGILGVLARALNDGWLDWEHNSAQGIVYILHLGTYYALTQRGTIAIAKANQEPTPEGGFNGVEVGPSMWAEELYRMVTGGLRKPNKHDKCLVCAKRDYHRKYKSHKKWYPRKGNARPWPPMEAD